MLYNESEKKLRNTFQRLRPEEFSSGDSAGDFALRSFRQPPTCRRLHCSLPLNRQLSELSYLLQCFNLFICHLASLPISNFGKLLRKTSANYFGKLRKTTSVKYIDENSSGRNLGTKTPQTEASGKCSSISFAPLLPSPSNKAGWAYRSKLLRDYLYIISISSIITYV